MMGIGDVAVIWNGCVLWLLGVFFCLNICVYLSFTAHQVGCRASDFLLAYHPYSIPCCYASAARPRCITSSVFCLVLVFSFVGLSEWTALYPFTCHLKTRPSRYYGKDNPHAELGGSQFFGGFFLVVLKELSDALIQNLLTNAFPLFNCQSLVSDINIVSLNKAYSQNSISVPSICSVCENRRLKYEGKNWVWSVASVKRGIFQLLHCFVGQRVPLFQNKTSKCNLLFFVCSNEISILACSYWHTVCRVNLITTFWVVR